MVTAQPRAVDPVDAVHSFQIAWDKWFAVVHDPTGLRSERNILRYVPIGNVLIRVGPDTPEGAAHAALCAADICRVRAISSDADPATGRKLVDQAHQVCPYSNATRGNIPVEIVVE